MTPLPAEFLSRPIAHRGLHDLSKGLQENAPGAFSHAIRHGYGIELDLQMSADGHAMVFHDYDLERLTGVSGLVHAYTAAELGEIRLKGAQECIPTLIEILKLVDGRVPVLIEVKDQDGALGQNTGALERELARILADYSGAVAVMSFNPHAMAVFRDEVPDVPIGLISCDFTSVRGWSFLPEDRRRELTDIPDFERIGASFISHHHKDLTSEPVGRLKSAGASILCWTVRSTAEESIAREVAHNVTFEGYFA